MKVTKVVEKAELEGGAPRYEHTGEHEVDRSAHEVKRRLPPSGSCTRVSSLRAIHALEAGGGAP